jgi:hypothetical protein
MSDPVGDRLRSYYRAIEADPPARLTSNVARGFESATPPHGFRTFWRPAFGAGIVAVVVIVGALVLRGVGPLPLPTPSGPVAASQSASPGGSPTGSTEPSQTPTETPTPTPATTATETPGPSPTPTPTPSPTPSPAPTLAINHFGTAFSNSLGRNFYTATLLQNGKVLIAGGLGTGSGGPIGRLTAAQLWDPDTGKFTATGSLNVPRYQHTATLLKNGKVLLVGGADMSDGYDNLASAELYDPATGKFAVTGSLAIGRARHTATLLNDGRVLIAGGANTLSVSEAEIYNPATGEFTVTGSMTYSRERATATALKDGRVLVAGGMGSETQGAPEAALASAEIYDPSSGTFTATEPMNVARYDQAAAGFFYSTHPSAAYVLLAGGKGASGSALNSAEVFDPVRGNFGLTPQPMTAARGMVTTTTLQSGGVLVVGGTGSTATADLFDPTGAQFNSIGSAGNGGGQTATLLGDCRILLSGTGGKSWELFRPSATCGG